MDHGHLEEAVPEPKVERKKRTQRGMSREQLERKFPSLSVLTGPSTKATREAWVAVFNVRPDAMHRLLADYIKQVHAQPGRIGQRPMPEEQQVDFQSLIYGEENERPLTEVLPQIMRSMGIGARTLAERVLLSRTQVQRLLAGEYDPDVDELRRIAAAVRKPPIFFLEYRKAMAVAAFLNLIEERPGIATALYRQYLEVRLT